MITESSRRVVMPKALSGVPVLIPLVALSKAFNFM
jgi:hypothetical protein